MFKSVVCNQAAHMVEETLDRGSFQMIASDEQLYLEGDGLPGMHFQFGTTNWFHATLSSGARATGEATFTVPAGITPVRIECNPSWGDRPVPGLQSGRLPQRVVPELQAIGQAVFRTCNSSSTFT